MENRPAYDPRGPIRGVKAQTAVRDAGFAMPRPHCHPYFELFYVESGACRFFLESQMYDLHAGDFLLIPPEVFHSTRYLSGRCKRNNVLFARDDLDRAVAALLPRGEDFLSAPRVFQTPEALRETMDAQFSRMLHEERLGDERSGPMLRAMLQELLLLCARTCRFPDSIPADIHTTDRQIVQAAQFIHDHYAERITARDIAAAAGYSPNYLTKKFRASVGIGPHEYLAFLRLRCAALLLATTDEAITQIAFRCGFSDSSYFKDAFKKRYGVTPRAYRKRL